MERIPKHFKDSGCAVLQTNACAFLHQRVSASLRLGRTPTSQPVHRKMIPFGNLSIQTSKGQQSLQTLPTALIMLTSAAAAIWPRISVGIAQKVGRYEKPVAAVVNNNSESGIDRG